MEHEGSLPCSQEPATGLSVLGHVNPVHIFTPYLFNIHFKLFCHLDLTLSSVVSLPVYGLSFV